MHGAIARTRHNRLFAVDTSGMRANALFLVVALAFSWGLGAARESNTTALAPIFVTPRDPVYEFLDRVETKGLLSNAELSMKPWTRLSIARALLEINRTDSSVNRLTAVDKELLRFFAGEYRDETRAISDGDPFKDLPSDPSQVFSDRVERWSRPSFEQDDIDARVGIAVAYTARRDTGTLYRRHAEVNGRLRKGSHWGFQAAFRDIAEWGKFSAPPPPFDRTPGFAHVDGDTGRTYYYDDPEALISYCSGSVTASFGVFPLTIGRGQFGNVVLSDKAPAFPTVRLSFRPFEWLSLTYLHGSLQSGVPDTTSAWHRAAPSTAAFMSKYYVAHRIAYTGIPGVEVGAGESLVYGGRGVAARYLIPVIPFRAAQHSEGDLDNLQMWGDLSVSRLPWTKLYGSLFIDELSLNQLFKEDNIHNWWAWQYGAHVADFWGLIPDCDLFVEYTRANPWVYRHRYPWNTYDTWSVRGNQPVTAYPLGFWQGHNGDYLRGEINWRPLRWLRVGAWVSQARRGGDGSEIDQYNPPAEEFLFGPRTRTREIHVNCSVEWLRDFVLQCDMGRIARNADGNAGRTRKSWTSISGGIAYGVW